MDEIDNTTSFSNTSLETVTNLFIRHNRNLVQPVTSEVVQKGDSSLDFVKYKSVCYQRSAIDKHTPTAVAWLGADGIALEYHPQYDVFDMTGSRQQSLFDWSNYWFGHSEETERAKNLIEVDQIWNSNLNSTITPSGFMVLTTIFTKNSKNSVTSYTQEMKDIKTKAIADGTFMKAPNGNPTNLEEWQWLVVRTKAFKEWFGDWENNPDTASKVVDENGEPLVVYHGTINHNLTKFNNEDHIWFASEIAHKYHITYPSQREAELKPLFINIKHPTSDFTYKPGYDINVRKLAKYDGALPKPFVEGNITKHDIQSLSGFALLSNQAKSAIDNVEFSRENDDIYDKIQKQAQELRNKENLC
jgi:hypothetical protein